MATAAQLIERFAPLTGLLPSSLERMLRAVRVAGFLPAGGRGGGKASAHLGVHQISYSILALAGPLPSDGPEAVGALRELPYRGTRNSRPNAEQLLPTLEDQLAAWIDYIAHALLVERHPVDDPGFDPIRSMRIALCLNPLSAIITIGPDEALTTIVYAATPGPERAMRRLTILSGDLLMAAGELLADTNEQHNAIECVQFLGKTQPAKAGQEQKSAGHPRQGVPAPFSDRPHANGTGSPADRPEHTSGNLSFQGYAKAGAVTPSTEWRTPWSITP